MDMRPTSIKQHEWIFANMAPISITKHKMFFGEFLNVANSGIIFLGPKQPSSHRAFIKNGI